MIIFLLGSGNTFSCVETRMSCCVRDSAVSSQTLSNHTAEPCQNGRSATQVGPFCLATKWVKNKKRLHETPDTPFICKRPVCNTSSKRAVCLAFYCYCSLISCVARDRGQWSLECLEKEATIFSTSFFCLPDSSMSDPLLHKINIDFWISMWQSARLGAKQPGINCRVINLFLFFCLQWFKYHKTLCRRLHKERRSCNLLPTSAIEDRHDPLSKPQMVTHPSNVSEVDNLCVGYCILDSQDNRPHASPPQRPRPFFWLSLSTISFPNIVQNLIPRSVFERAIPRIYRSAGG